MAENIQYHMKKNNKTRQELCEALNVPYTTLTDWLNGKTYPRIDKIEIMSHYFGISKADLVEEKPAIQEDDELTAKEKEYIKLYRAATPELQAAAMAALEAAEKARLAQDSSEEDK